MDNKSFIYKNVPNVDKWIHELQSYLTNSPYLLPLSIYNRLSDYINKLVISKADILKKKTKVTNLPDFKAIYEEALKYYQFAFEKWLKSQPDKSMLVTIELYKWMETINLNKEIEQIRKNEGNISEKEIGKIYQNSFVISHFVDFLKLMDYTQKLLIEDGYIKIQLKNSAITFLPIAIRTSIFMIHFGKNLFRKEPIQLLSFLDLVECHEESVSICENLNAIFRSKKFVTSDISSKIYVLFPETYEYAAYNKNDLVKNIIKCTINQPYYNCKFVITEKLINRISSKHRFNKSDELLLNRLNLSQSWIKEEVFL